MPARRESRRVSLLGDVCPWCDHQHAGGHDGSVRVLRRDRRCEGCGGSFRSRAGQAVAYLTRALTACDVCGTRTTVGDDGLPEPHGCPAARPVAAPPAVGL